MKDDTVYLTHIIQCIALVEDFTKDGEATKRLSTSFRQAHPEIPWQQMAGMRDVLIHDYLGVDIHQVWLAASKRLPELEKALSKILAR